MSDRSELKRAAATLADANVKIHGAGAVSKRSVDIIKTAKAQSQLKAFLRTREQNVKR